MQKMLQKWLLEKSYDQYEPLNKDKQTDLTKN